MLFIIWHKVRMIKVVSGRSLDARHVLYVSPSLAGLGSTAGPAVAAELPEKYCFFSDLFSDFCQLNNT